MKKYEIKKNNREIPLKNSKDIKPGCTIDTDKGYEPEMLGSFDEKEIALKELANYKTEMKNVTAFIEKAFLLGRGTD